LVDLPFEAFRPSWVTVASFTSAVLPSSILTSFVADPLVLLEACPFAFRHLPGYSFDRPFLIQNFYLTDNVYLLYFYI
jgi:hypothetical protein